VDQQQQSRWRPTGTQVLWMAIGVVGLFAAIVVFGGYYFEWKWTGYPKRTPWDWVDLLIVPVVLALGGYLFTRSENQRTQQIAERQREADREIAQQQAETDRRIAEQRIQDDTLQAYLDQMGQLLLDKDRSLRQSKKGDEIQTLARARTLTVLARLDADHQGSVLQFLYESRLITEYKVNTHPKFDVTVEVVLELHGADLSEANLIGISLSGSDQYTAEPIVANLSLTNFSGANLSRAGLDRATLIMADLFGANLSSATMMESNLHWANLSGANLSGSYLFRANLGEVDLTEADLSGADLSEAYLGLANLSGADLSGANLSGATGVSNEELARQAASLEGATMPNGQKYEDWLKSKARGEGGENSGPS
jgi:uncharacterized protein YjbI with pentapeptide repeats